ncbi:serine/threonine-protein kinase grp isoform X2 [Epargyreus clarus]|uniref:serine/threonine-protein kinase grp isoform X2 n=1 Tax=Epargyreus clarus TaxID=520877 RepID=UPI003C2FB951
MAGEFVEGWFAAQVLGEGAYGEVRLLVQARTGACVALKAVRAGGEGAREAALHRALRHPHVLRCYGERDHRHLHYLFLEYAQGGELFDRIEPDVGMPEKEARRYWRQTLEGLAYLHGRGVAHRDIKPENLLLDEHDQIKISDFGMATLFRHGARERLLARVCGTLPYAAPEVLGAAAAPYRAPPADVWAAAVVLLAMLAGELPWERAHESEPRFVAWSQWAEGAEAAAEAPRGPWRKLRGGARALLRRALQPAAARRAALPALLQHRWLRDEDAAVAARVWSSQPARGAGGDAAGDAGGDAVDGAAAGVGALSAAAMDALLSHSQPAHADDLLLATPPDATLGTQQGVLARLVRRMTRVWLHCDEAAAVQALVTVLQQKGYVWRHLQPRLLAIESSCGVRMRAWSAAAGAGAARSLLEFRRSRGCGLAFKRRYLELRAALAPLAAPPPAAPLPMDTLP